jgi:hypothetical protein
VLRTAYDANNKQSLKVSSYPFENVNFFEKPYKIARTNLLGPSTVGTRHSVFKLSTAPAMRRAKKSPTAESHTLSCVQHHTFNLNYLNNHLINFGMFCAPLLCKEPG